MHQVKGRRYPGDIWTVRIWTVKFHCDTWTVEIWTVKTGLGLWLGLELGLVLGLDLLFGIGLGLVMTVQILTVQIKTGNQGRQITRICHNNIIGWTGTVCITDYISMVVSMVELASR